MREIKFKVWHPVYGIGLPTDIFEMTSFKYDNGNGSKTIEKHFEPVVVFLQYTGLKDKNEKEIYDGDILHDPRCPQWFNWLVEYHEGSVCLINIGVDGYRHAPMILSQSSASERVVIGNRYENPELCP